MVWIHRLTQPYSIVISVAQIALSYMGSTRKAMICHGWKCQWYFTSISATVGKITLWKHYVAIYQEQNKCICEDVNAVMTEWWILEVFAGLRVVCCTSSHPPPPPRFLPLHQSTPGKSVEAINLHLLSQSFILVLGLTNIFQYQWTSVSEETSDRKKDKERDRSLKFNKHALKWCWHWTTLQPTSSMSQGTRHATWQTIMQLLLYLIQGRRGQLEGVNETYWKNNFISRSAGENQHCWG
jgi:hypothetical protein